VCWAYISGSINLANPLPELRALGAYDYGILLVYMIMVLSVGVYVSRFNRASGDYFKGGGQVPWVLAGLSLFISGFSAFMFVGAAGVTYGNGGGALLLFSLAFPAYMLGYWIYGPLWRRTRIDTPMQFLQRRYSPSTTYVYSLLAIIPNVLTLGIWLYMLCIFVSSALGFQDLTVSLGGQSFSGFQMTVLVTGAVLVTYSVLGGLWAVMVTDAVQFIILLVISLVLFPAAFAFLGDGSFSAGVSRLFQEAPEGYFSINLADQPPVFWIAYLLNVVMGYNVNWHIAQRYYSVGDERDTRKMALWCAILGLVLPMLWILPVLTTPILFPDMAALWPHLAKPSEAAFVSIALAVLPHGLLGIMVAAIFAATMSSADTSFNWLGAVITKDVLVPISRRLKGMDPSERAQLLMGKLSVAIMGLFSIWVAFNMDKYGGAFDVYLRADSIYKPAMFVPVMLGLLYTRTPWWSGIAAVLGGVLAIVLVGVGAQLAQGGGASVLDAVFSNLEITLGGVVLTRYEINTLVGISVSTLIFAGSAFFDRREGAFATRITALEQDLKTPALAATGVPADPRGLSAFRITAWMSIGLGLLLLGSGIFFVDGRLLNFASGLTALLIGIIIHRLLIRALRRSPAP
jgi:SSS family solute:Na+ symporter